MSLRGSIYLFVHLLPCSNLDDCAARKHCFCLQRWAAYLPLKTRSISAVWIKTKLHSWHTPRDCALRRCVYGYVWGSEWMRRRAGVHICGFCLYLSWRLIGGSCQSQEETCWTALSELTPRLPPDVTCLSAYFTPRRWCWHSPLCIS